MDRVGWQATGHGVAKSWTQLSNIIKSGEESSCIKDILYTVKLRLIQDRLF